MAKKKEKELVKTDDDKLVEEAKKRFKRVEDWESDFRNLYLEDTKFANGDSDNKWQWPVTVQNLRGDRPMLTINKTQQHVFQVTNDARQNKAAITIKPTAEEVSFDAAQIYEGLIREIERASRAQSIYDEATQSQVEGGIGYWRVISEYDNENSFDQNLRIAPIRDQMGVYLDCDIKQKDGGDAKFGFIFEDMDDDEFKKAHPKVTLPPTVALGEKDAWIQKDHIRVAEYYRIQEENDKLIFMEDDQGNETTFKLSEAPPEFKKIVEKPPEGYTLKKRKIIKKKLQWFKIAGNEIIDRRDLPGKYIPIIRLVGRERVIEGKLHRRGLVRSLKDAQRMYNYNTSAGVEFGALQTKSPFLTPAAAVEGLENYWNNLNTQNLPYLPYNHIDAETQEPIPPPTRPAPPEYSGLYQAGMQIAANEMEMASGQTPAQFGMPGNEKSGKAISERQRQADNATYDFIDNQAIAIRHTGNVILDLIPYYYDTNRVIQILGKDGKQTKVYIDPSAEQAYSKRTVKDQVEEVLFNPSIGKYLVESDVGPAYATQRQEAWNAFVQIIASSPDMANVIGDLMFLSADFPNADKIAERLRRQIQANSPWLLDPDAQNPKISQLEAAIQDSQTQISELLQKVAEQSLELKSKAAASTTNVYKAETERLKAFPPMDPGVLRAAFGQLIQDIVNTPLTPVVQASSDDLALDATGQAPPHVPPATPTAGDKMSIIGQGQQPIGQGGASLTEGLNNG